MRKFRTPTALLLVLLLLTGCAAGPGLSAGAILLVLLLTVFASCRPSLDEKRLGEFYLRAIFLDRQQRYGRDVCMSFATYDAVLDLSAEDLAATGRGFKITGENAAHELGRSVSASGDFNGDGISDFMVGAPYYSGNIGRVYLVYGQNGKTRADIDAAAFATGDGIEITGAAPWMIGQHGRKLRRGGDIDGDGFDDVLIGSSTAGLYGQSWIVFGGASPASIPDLNVTDPAYPMFDADGLGGYYAFGGSIASPGDINGDGLSDVIIGSENSNYGLEGRPFVLYGKTSGWSATQLVDSLGTSDGYGIEGEGNLALLSWFGPMNGVGDVNGDGVGDMLIPFGRNPGGYNAGGALIVYGTSGTRASFSVGGGISAADGYKLTGTNTNDQWGRSTASGDFNGDGFQDFAVGSYDYNGTNGRAAIFLENTGTLTIGSHAPGQGFTLDGAGAERSAKAMAMDGDINGDGLSDLVIGADQADNSGANSGSVYVIFGGSNIASNGATLTSLVDGVNGFRIDGPAASARLGYDVALADVNGDGCSDIIMGAPDGGAGNDYAFVVYGGQAE